MEYLVGGRTKEHPLLETGIVKLHALGGWISGTKAKEIDREREREIPTDRFGDGNANPEEEVATDAGERRPAAGTPWRPDLEPGAERA
uniref:Uncharacterized protein n=1 Tax=Oryza rufipogon TaxID=4529 RepID=A0A0E0MV27_ORYRU